MTDGLEPVGDVVGGEDVEPDKGGSTGLVRASARVEVQRVHEGPLPAPEDFARYDQVLPGAAERIMTLTESTVEHRHRLDNRHLNAVGLIRLMRREPVPVRTDDDTDGAHS